MKNNHKKIVGIVSIIFIILIGVFIVYMLTSNKDNINNHYAETTTESGRDSETNILAGLYPDGGELIELKMGTEIDGIETALCIVKLPSEYIMTASGNVFGLTDYTLKNLVKEQPEILQKAHSMIAITSEIDSGLFSIKNDTIDNIKSNMLDRDDYNEVYKEKGDIGTEEHPAYYYHYVLDDFADQICFVYQINDNYVLNIGYDYSDNKQFVNEIGGMEQFAQNLYNIVDVIE